MALAQDVFTASDATYTIVDSSGTVVGTRRTEGALTWEYVGQYVFVSEMDSAFQGPRWVDAGLPSSTDPISQLLDTFEVDHLGRKWVVVDVNLDRIQQEWSESTERDPAAKLHPSTPDSSSPDTKDVDTPGYETLFSWGNYDCEPMGAPDGVNDQTLSGNSEGRIHLSPPTGRQTKAVVIQTYGHGACSGVLVDEEYVLTAAHCVTNAANGSVRLPEAVCPLGNNYAYTTDSILCQTVYSVTPNPSYPGSNTGNMEDDYALIKLFTPTTPAMLKMGVEWGYMTFSQAADTYVDNFPSYTFGYPGVLGGGGNACNYFPPYHTTYADSLANWTARELWRSDASIIGYTNSGRVETDHDASGGDSGSAIYYCEDAAGCSSSHIERITGLLVGNHNPTVGTEYNGGPEVSKFRSWAEGILPNQ